MHKFIAIIILLAAGTSHAQVFSGNVVDRDNKALVGVIARWANSTAGTVTNESGYFRLDRQAENKALVLSYIGFQTDTIIVPDDLVYEVYYM
ncbi:MAG TPA: carboxypeptidase-like regulatory domain-containing protein, partial [Saprospiraceae bacterium]|nr:carboxypeptidase-like regulatory domain-containing protein [Saprospiraceae bacterium]